jgi:hypothetical protein
MVASGANTAEELAVNAADRFPIFGVREVHTRADDIVERRTGFCQGFGGDGEDAASLSCCIAVFGADGTGSSEMHETAYADCAGEADDGLVGGTAADVLAHGNSGIRCPGSGIRKASWTEP